jgi:S1-C subfamily serine protease
MQLRWFKHVLPAVLVPGLCLALLAPAGAAPVPAARAFLGVAVGPVKDSDTTGAMVHDVTPDSPAARAGLKKGDIIIKIDDQEVKAPEAVVETVKGHKAGDAVKLHVQRDGEEKTFEVTLGERRAVTVAPMPEVFGKRPAFLGVWTRELNDEVKKELGVEADKGAVVADVMPHSPAAKAGLKKDDVITEVNGQAIANPEELRTTIQKLEPGKEAAVKVLRGNETREFQVELRLGLFGFGGLGDFEKDFPMLKDGHFRFEKFPGAPADIEKLFEEMRNRIRELEQQQKQVEPDRSL